MFLVGMTIDKFFVQLPPGVAFDRRLRQYMMKGSPESGDRCKHWVVRSAGRVEEILLD